MKLSNHQWKFLQDIARLIIFAEQDGYMLTGGQLQRFLAQQKIFVAEGKSEILRSRHLVSLAIDFNIFVDEKYIFNKSGELIVGLEEIEPLARYWESLSPENVAGFYWKKKDVPHFERRQIPRKVRLTYKQIATRIARIAVFLNFNTVIY